jgi:signal transduction histidine kinase
MRRRLDRLALTAVTTALLLLLVPLLVAVYVLAFEAESREVEATALAASVGVGSQYLAGDPVDAPTGGLDGEVGLYDLEGHRRSGAGPARAERSTLTAGLGRLVRARAGGQVVAAVPVTTDERVIGIVRAAEDASAVWWRVLAGWAVLLTASVAAMVVAVGLARRQSRRLTSPLERLRDAARAIADDGGYTTTPGTSTLAVPGCSGIPEIDELARVQADMVRTITTQLRREREFTANASHQLRTPLMGLQLGLEAALDGSQAQLTAAVREALGRAGRLSDTVDQVLATARPATSEAARGRRLPVAELLTVTGQRWHGALAAQGRRLVLRDDLQAGLLSVPDRLLQVLDVLVANAAAHGRGQVRVTVRDVVDGLAIDVADEGRLTADPTRVFARGVGSGTGIGLALAREVAESVGGRLLLTTTDPTVFGVVLPLPDGSGGGEEAHRRGSC